MPANAKFSICTANPKLRSHLPKLIHESLLSVLSNLSLLIQLVFQVLIYFLVVNGKSLLLIGIIPASLSSY